MNNALVATTLALLLVACGGSPAPAPQVQAEPRPEPRVCNPPAVTAASVEAAFRPTPVTLSPQAVLRQASWQARRAQGEVLVVGTAGGSLSAQSVGSVEALSGLDVEYVEDGLARVTTPAGETDEQFAARLASQGLLVQPNYHYELLAAPTPNDPRYRDQNYLVRINAKQGWDVVYGFTCATGVRTAVLDTGVNASHEDLQGRLLPGRDFCATVTIRDVNGSKNYNCSGEDATTEEVGGVQAGHGTSSIGIVGAATFNGKGIAGLTWKEQNILPVKVFGTAEDGTTIADTVALRNGLRWAVAQGARVVNMSVGVIGANTDTVLSSEIAAADARGVVMVAAAGNDPSKGILYPASDPRVLAVGAVGSSNSLASYSARPSAARDLDLVAPGGEAGAGILSLGMGNTEYRMWVGTSEAAPQVAGAAALLRAYRPNLTAAQVRDLLKRTARVLPNGDYPLRLLDVGAAMLAATDQ